MDQGQLTALDPRRRNLMDIEPRLVYSPHHRGDTVASLRVARPRVVEQSRRMARNYNVHLLTLAQVATLLRVEGSWPGPIALSSGWYRARARPWNESVTDPMVRLERGGSEFLEGVNRRLAELGAVAAYSPALYPGSTRVWTRSGFESFATLDVMERTVSNTPVSRPGQVRRETEPEWDTILDIDRDAFEGFWGMSRLGLSEAHDTNRSTALFVADGDGDLSGYAIVGAQWGTVYLHRIAVRPGEAGRGIGAELVSACIDWGARTGSRSMVLNVRPENSRAKSLYNRLGFADTGTSLRVLRRDFP